MNNLPDLASVEASARCLFSREQIEAALDLLIEQIHQDLAGTNPVVLGVMRGALPMLGYLMPRLRFYAEIDYVHATRYQKNLTTGELLWIHEPHLSIKDRQVLLVDDILDRGITLKSIAKKCYALGAKDVKIAVLCKKHIADFEAEISANYVAVQVPDAYIFGYGMDYEGGWRNAPGIYELII